MKNRTQHVGKQLENGAVITFSSIILAGQLPSDTSEKEILPVSSDNLERKHMCCMCARSQGQIADANQPEQRLGKIKYVRLLLLVRYIRQQLVELVLRGEKCDLSSALSTILEVTERTGHGENYQLTFSLSPKMPQNRRF